MPVQINEVIIKAVVDENATSGQTNTTNSQPSVSTSSESLIAERVIEILKEKKER